MDEELEEELNFIVRKNRILRSQPEERPSKSRKKNTDLDNEAACEKKYKAIRRGELTEDMDNKPLAYLCNEYVKYNRYALGKVSDR